MKTQTLLTLSLFAMLQQYVSGQLPESPRFVSTSNEADRAGSTMPVAQLDQGFLVQDECAVFAINDVELAAQQSGLIESVLVQRNQRVDADAPLAQIEESSQRLEHSLAILQAKIAAEEAMDDSDIQFARQLVEDANIELEKFIKIEQRGGAGDWEIRRKRLAVAQAELRVTQAEAAKRQREIKSQIAAANVEALAKKLASMRIKSPVSGIVTEVHKTAGEWVQAGDPVCRVVRMDQLRVDFFVRIDECDPAQLVGSPVQVTAKRDSNEPIQLAGIVSSYSPSVTSLGIVSVQATIQNHHPGNFNWQLLPGMSVTLKTRLNK